MARALHALAFCSLAAATVLVVLSSVHQSEARPLTCSAGPDFDPVAVSDVIVAGRITSYEVTGPRPVIPGATPGKDQSPFFPVRLYMDVDVVLKGELNAAIMDHRSLTRVPDGPPGSPERDLWAGGSGSCGALDEDPTGLYVVFGLHRLEDGTLSTGRLETLYIGREPYDLAALQRRNPFLRQLTLPASGDGKQRDTMLWQPFTVPTAASLLAGAAAVMLAGGLTVRRRP